MLGRENSPATVAGLFLCTLEEAVYYNRFMIDRSNPQVCEDLRKWSFGIAKIFGTFGFIAGLVVSPEGEETRTGNSIKYGLIGAAAGGGLAYSGFILPA